MIVIFSSLIVWFILLSPSFPLHAATISLEMGKDSASVAAGGSIGTGFGLIGISSTFTTDAPWSYVETTKDLQKPCEEFQADSTKNCEPKGSFHDGDEWEIFARVGIRVPHISRLYINTGLGISYQKIARLFIFCVGLSTAGASCSQASSFETWGEIETHYFLTYLGGLSLEMTDRLFIHLNYHSRQGVLGGVMWKF